MIDMSMPGSRKLPEWLRERAPADTLTRISLKWEEEDWQSVVRDTPEESWLALALHPRSQLHYPDGWDPFKVTSDNNDSLQLYCAYANDRTRAFLGLMMATWLALRETLVTGAQRQELLDAELNLKDAQKRLRAACAAVPVEVTRRVLKREAPED